MTKKAPAKGKKRTKKQTKKRTWKKRILVWGIKLAVLGIILAAAGYFYLFHYVATQNPDNKFTRERIIASLESEVPVYYRDGKTLLGSFFNSVHRRYVPFDDIPQHLVNAVVSGEDARFWDHPGMDVMGIARAAVANFKAGRVVQGASTLTQQTAKNIFGREARSFAAKWDELKDALRLEHHFDKKTILEFYLNQFHVVGTGRGVGIAAHYFFNRKLNELTLKECAFIAASLKGPHNYDPFRKRTPTKMKKTRKKIQDRVAYILGRMAEDGKISSAEKAEAIKDSLRFEKGIFRKGTNPVLEHIIERMDSPWMTQHLKSKGIEDWRTAHLHIITTLDKSIQKNARKALQDSLSILSTKLRKKTADSLIQGGIRVVHQGEVLASINGHQEAGFDRVHTARRQFGSVWKPLLYALAMELGWAEDDVIENRNNAIPHENKFYFPNPDHKKRGDRVTLRWAAVRSENIASIQLLVHLLDKMDTQSLIALAKEYEMLPREGEGEKEYRKRMDGIGIVLGRQANAEIRYVRARRNAVMRLGLSARFEEADYVEWLPLGWGYERFLNMRGLARWKKNFIRENFLSLINEAAQYSEDSLKNKEYLSGTFITPKTLGEISEEMGEDRLMPNKNLLAPENLVDIPEFRSKLARKVFVQFCKKLGIQAPLANRNGFVPLNLPLGVREITLAELARAYEAIFTGREWYSKDKEFRDVLIKEIRARNGDVVFADKAESHKLLSDSTRVRMQLVLESVVQHGTGRRADYQLKVKEKGAARSLKFSAAGKTGTTNGCKTAAFSGAIPGYDPQLKEFTWDMPYVISAYAGLDKNGKMYTKRGCVSGASGALPMWIATAKGIIEHDGLKEAVDFDRVDYILSGRATTKIALPVEKRRVDRQTGLISDSSKTRQVRSLKIED